MKVKHIYILIALSLLLLFAWIWYDQKQKTQEYDILLQALDSDRELEGGELESLLLGVAPKAYEGIHEDVLAIEEAINQYFMPWSDDVNRILAILQGKSLPQLAALNKQFAQQFGHSMIAYFKAELGENEYQRINALVNT